jgi:hypothetical protein
VTNQLIILERGNAYGYIYFLSCIYEWLENVLFSHYLPLMSKGQFEYCWMLVPHTDVVHIYLPFQSTWWAHPRFLMGFVLVIVSFLCNVL